MTSPVRLERRSVGEWTSRSTRNYENPFTDVAVDAAFTSPNGNTFTIPAFYDGDQVWRVRFSPGEPGRWSYRIAAYPADPELSTTGVFEVSDRSTRGFLRATPGDAWGFR